MPLYESVHGLLHRKLHKRKVEQEETVDEATRQAKLIKKHINYQFHHKQWANDLREFLKTTARVSPLFAALIAPLSTLYDIPGLSQHWYLIDGVGQPDPAPNLALSAIGLAFNILANGLLIWRFSAQKRWWKTLMISSTACWVIKTIIAMVNLAIYGANRRNEPQYAYSEGFWCAVFSCGIAGIISVLLCLFAGFAEYHQGEREDKDVRVQARHFLLTELAFFLLMAIEALIISRLEGWSYFDAIYFATITALTVGFGSDYSPTTTASRILVFPFAVITIAGLAAQVSAIISFFSTQAETRRARWRQLYESRQEAAYADLHPTDELIAEMQFLDKLVKQENAISRLYDLVLSLIAFLTFWFLGALVFHYLEGWTYGTSLYFCYVFFLTIGYGDFYPTTNCGRVFFVLYALVAVPIIASFAVQTVSQLMTAFNESRLEKQKVKRGIEPRLNRSTTIKVRYPGGEKPSRQPSNIGEEGDGNAPGNGNGDGGRRGWNSHDDDDEDDEVEDVSPFISHEELVVQEHERYKDEQKVKADQGDSVAADKLKDEKDMQKKEEEEEGKDKPSPAEEEGSEDQGSRTPPLPEDHEKASTSSRNRKSHDLTSKRKAKLLAEVENDFHKSHEDRYKDDEQDGGPEADGDDDIDRPGSDETAAPDRILRKADELNVPMEDDERDRSKEIDILDDLLVHALHLEEVARKLIMSKLDQGSKGRILLQADKNVMQRAVELERQAEEERDGSKGSKAKPATFLPPSTTNDLEDIYIYRETFARMLVAGTRLKRLQGKEQLLFEKRRGSPYYHGKPVEAEQHNERFGIQDQR